ncbi:hypothetical protein [Photobacterium nomapromontoriensis]|uniref:hypothetical protein n=1 Tax=Photobacterium nomapromontoriensis TaxID=2910237 RepID=UPI003D0DEC9D
MSLDDVDVQMKHFIDALDTFREEMQKRQLNWFELAEEQQARLSPDQRREIAPHLAELGEELLQIHTLVPGFIEPLQHRQVLLRRYLNED